MRLANTIRYDLKLQFRHGFYYAYFIVCIVYIIIIRALPPGIRQYALVMTLLTDPSILGFIFLGGIIFLEKGQQTLEGLFITPIRPSEYVWSKAISLTILALLSSFLITIVSVGMTFNFLWLFLGISLTSLLFVFLGFTLISFTSTINGYLFSSPIYYILAVIPVMDFFEIFESSVFYIIPTQSSLTLIKAAFSTVPFGEVLLSVVLLMGFNCLAYPWAMRCFHNYIIVRTGAET